jgi:rubrerythrin
MPMTIEEAIQTAIEYETNVRDVYGSALEYSKDPVGQRVYRVLADEEQGHLNYLHHKLEELKKTGAVTPETLETCIPSIEVIRRGIGLLEERMSDEDRGREIEMLKKARDVEEKTGNFYKKMVAELPEEGRRFFERFVEIEEGHLAIVQAELDYVSGSGHWFDYREFDLEAD